MDPLDQRLSDAGSAWRHTQPEPPDLDRIVAGFDRRRPRGFVPRLGFVIVAGLVLLGAVAVAAGAGGVFRGEDDGLLVPATPTPAATTVPPTSTPAPTPAPTPTAASTSPQPSDAAQAAELVDRYEAALVAGQWRTAFDMLAATSWTHGLGYDAYASERAPYFESVAGRYTVGTPTRDVADWSIYTPLIDGVDTSRAYLVEVDYPALAGNNAGYEQFVVARDASGGLKIWPVR